MIEKIQKRAVIFGFFFFVASAAITLLDSASSNSSVLESIKPFTIPMLGEYTEVANGILTLIYLISSIAFYWSAWINSKKSITFLTIIYTTNALLVLVEWSLTVQLGVTEFFSTLSCFADGVIFTCILLNQDNKHLT